jgi:hypothetical protein
MSAFDKFCACLAIPVGFCFMALGAFGVLFGSKAHFTLPPILGGLPFFMGWAMSITLIRYWKLSRPNSDDEFRDGERSPDDFGDDGTPGWTLPKYSGKNTNSQSPSDP